MLSLEEAQQSPPGRRDGRLVRYLPHLQLLRGELVPQLLVEELLHVHLSEKIIFSLYFNGKLWENTRNPPHLPLF